MFWASEKWMLSVACSRGGVEIGEIHEVAEDMHYSFGIDKDAEIAKPKVKAAAGKYVAPVYNGQQGQQNWKGSYNNSATSPANNVLTLPPAEKKSIPLENQQSSSPQLIESYTNAKRILFEIVASRIDNHGARYLHLMDVLVPAAHCRLYLKKNDPMQNMVGRELIADISGFVTKNQVGFFKVSPWNVVIVPEAPKNDGAYLIYKDHNGRLFNKKEWENKYPNCSFCFDPLYAEDHGNRLTSDGECLCSKCSGNALAVENVKLSKVY